MEEVNETVAAAPEHVTQTSGSAEATVDMLQKKLRGSRILNFALAGALLFVGGSYAALVFVPGTNAASGSGVNTATGAYPQTAQLPEQSAAQQPELDVATLATSDYMVLGDPNAPITLYEWTDYTCPYCGVFNRETLPVLVEEYIDTGKVRLEVHDVTFIGPQAEDAAVAARAAGHQDRYFDYLFAVYNLGANDNRPDLSRDTLFALADGLGLDMNRFETDFANAELRSTVQGSTALAQTLGVTGVPFFAAADTGSLEGLISINGAQPIDQFRQFLDAQIERATS